jgi:hypothetical protein
MGRPAGENAKVYIHEFVQIRGHNRSKYMHHATANWSPIGQADRNQLCFGVWGTVGSTARWPEVVNIWEEDGFAGLAESFALELNHPSLQDPNLAEWWAQATSLRVGGYDRLLIPAPWMLTIEQLCERGIRGDLYVHEQFVVPQGRSRQFLQAVADEAIAAHATFDFQIVGAWETGLINESECFLMWAVPSFAHWGAFEAAQRTDPGLIRWRNRTYELSSHQHRVLLVEAPLSPMRTGRQPRLADRDAQWGSS